MKSWLQKDDIEMNSIHTEGKSVVTERFIRTLKSKICKYMTSISKNVFINKLNDIVNKYNNTYHRAIKMKPVDVKSITYIDSNQENNNEGPKFKVGDHARKSKHKNIFAKDYVQNWCKEFVVIKKVKNTAPWTYVLSDCNGEGIVGMFYEKELQKKIKKGLELKK